MNYQGTKSNKGPRSLILLIAAFAAVYIVWGSTYLSIKYAIETIPPFLMAGLRFASAGAILYLIARLSPDFERPKLVHWRTSAVVGILLLVIGNGGVVYAERFIPSSLTALLVATEPFWIVLLSWLWLKGSRPTRKAALGLILGFVGVAVLITGQGAAPAAESLGPGQLWTTLAVMAAALSWAAGSIYGLRSPVPSSALLAAGMQMLAGGVALLVVSVFAGEWSTFSFNQVSANSWYGLGYLIVFGSLIGFTAYSWLLKNAEPTMVATYAYVNPVIAVILGWLIAGESMTMQMLMGAAVVVGSVVLITSKNEVVKEQDGVSELGDACSHSAAPRFST
jgi:drug/metabolite transporter (DMT)-like permease